VTGTTKEAKEKISQVKVVSHYQCVADWMHPIHGENLRSADEMAKILKEVHTELIFYLVNQNILL